MPALVLRCRVCRSEYALDGIGVCSSCFGPLDPVYDRERQRREVSRESIAAGPYSLWRYGALLPVETPAVQALAPGFTPLTPAPRLAEQLGVGELWLKLDTANPTHSFKDRGVAIAAVKAAELGLGTLSCSSTGNLANAVAARAAADGTEAIVFCPAGLEPEKLVATSVYGATLYAVDGSYDDVSRLTVELSFELPWAFVNAQLRSYYAEGSKTVGFEIAEQLGWRLPTAVFAPIGSGALYSKIHEGFKELRELGLVDGDAPRLYGGQAEGCAPVAAAFASGGTVTPLRPATKALSIAIGNPADGAIAIDTARESGGAIYAVPESEIESNIAELAAATGVWGETAPAVTFGALKEAVSRGEVGAADRVVLLVSGDGLKTPALVQALAEPRTIAADADAFLDSLSGARRRLTRSLRSSRGAECGALRFPRPRSGTRRAAPAPADPPRQDSWRRRRSRREDAVAQSGHRSRDRRGAGGCGGRRGRASQRREVSADGDGDGRGPAGPDRPGHDARGGSGPRRFASGRRQPARCGRQGASRRCLPGHLHRRREAGNDAQATGRRRPGRRARRTRSQGGAEAHRRARAGRRAEQPTVLRRPGPRTVGDRARRGLARAGLVEVPADRPRAPGAGGGVDLRRWAVTRVHAAHPGQAREAPRPRHVLRDRVPGGAVPEPRAARGADGDGRREPQLQPPRGAAVRSAAAAAAAGRDLSRRRGAGRAGPATRGSSGPPAAALRRGSSLRRRRSGSGSSSGRSIRPTGSRAARRRRSRSACSRGSGPARSSTCTTAAATGRQHWPRCRRSCTGSAPAACVSWRSSPAPARSPRRARPARARDQPVRST